MSRKSSDISFWEFMFRLFSFRNYGRRKFLIFHNLIFLVSELKHCPQSLISSLSSKAITPVWLLQIGFPQRQWWKQEIQVSPLMPSERQSAQIPPAGWFTHPQSAAICLSTCWEINSPESERKCWTSDCWEILSPNPHGSWTMNCFFSPRIGFTVLRSITGTLWLPSMWKKNPIQPIPKVLNEMVGESDGENSNN